MVLPSLYSELEGPALGPIIDELSQADYVSQIIIGLDRANREQFQHAKEFFARLPQPHKVLWNDGPRLRALDAKLAEMSLSPLEPGKGRNVWFCLGYMLASGRAKVVGLHDCDILHYSRRMIARLFYPLVHPSFDYRFAKGYYPRVADGKLNGRVTRLLVSPLLNALRKVCGPKDYIEYLDSFRYPLAGEFAMHTGMVPDLYIPSDWGLEVSILSEIRRNHSTNVICQVDIADRYDHKHQEISEHDATRGLSRMSIDIAKSIFRKLATDGEIFSSEKFRTLKATYYRAALDLLDSYYHDAILNGLQFDRHRESQTVELFAANIMKAGQAFLETPHEAPFTPRWRRVMSALPTFMDDFREAVAADNAE